MARGINAPGLVAAIAGRQAVAGLPHISGATDVTAAAWLAGKHRRSLRRSGSVDLVLNQGEAPERWFLVAIDVLQRRQGWDVVMLTRPGRKRVFRLRWLGWGTQRGRVGR